MIKKTKYITLVIGITGGIGSGKSSFCDVFKSLGTKTIHADNLAKELISKSPVLKKEILTEFGESVFLADGRLDRKGLATLVFGNKIFEERLNKIVHPAVLCHLKEEICRIREAGKYPMILIEAALIYEAKSESMFDYIITIDADEQIRIKRIMDRDQCSREDVLKRIGAQISTKEKVDRADFIIQNSDDKILLKNNATFIFRLLLQLAFKQAIVKEP